jgi:predicted DNA-binding transcriptional regulator AlpA
MMKNKIDGFLTVREAAAYLGLAMVTLNKWRIQGTGPNHCHFGYAVRYSLRDLDTYAQRCKITPKPRRKRQAMSAAV